MVLGHWHFTKTPEAKKDDVVVVKLIEIAPVSLAKTSSKDKSIDLQESGPKQLPDKEIPETQQLSNQNSVGQPFILPPSAHLSYTTSMNGNTNQPANITWNQTGSSYHLNVELWMLFVGDIKFKSIGNIDAYGISPTLYEEQVGKRVRSVHFDRESSQVRMTINNEVAPLSAGTQDRFSVIFQLAALVGGNPEIDAQGVARLIPIVDEWVFLSSGDIELPGHDGQMVTARHFKRQARSSDDRRSLEVWLAKEYSWLPLKIIQTEPNGTVYEMQLLKISEPNKVLTQ